MIHMLLAGLATALLVAGTAHAGPTLDAVKARGSLRCAVNSGLQGFAAPDSQGRWSGIDADFCRALAAVILGDRDKVDFRPSNTQNRFTMLQSGEVDILSRNTTWTASRDSALGLVFPGTLFYDGQGFMVPKSIGVTSARELDGATVCVLPGTTTELNLTDWFRSQSMQFKPVVISELSQIQQAFFAGRCDVFTTDISGLASTRQSADKPDDYVILPEAISKEPLGPVVRRDDWEFFTIVRWTLFGLIEAEEYGITSANAAQQRAENKSPSVQRMLGASGEIGKGLGLEPDWLVRAVEAVGNYGEMYERHIAPLGIPRGQNALWTNGGLMYPPPIR
ncbi:MAG: amino acid ABC transporter substrate-binding protein [Burkholderiaceae bacterium]|jgi:general L-amino acid transport system substrate-binding protein|nr:amino acid ABC transporter substrate-binding protein [Burkholderiaceae bacterium]